MRLDRFITLRIARPTTTSTTVPSRLPVLMYHSISDDKEPGIRPYYKVATSPSRFGEQMRWLAESGYKGVSLRSALKATLDSNSNPERVVAITFDDGFRDIYTQAAPILSRHRFSATVYLPTGFIRESRSQFKQRDCLTWAEIAELHQTGIEFGSHTVTHPKLVNMTWPVIEDELTASKQTIEHQLQSPVANFAYPYAFPQADREFSRRFSEAIVKAGYRSCATTAIGIARVPDQLQYLPRLPINSLDDKELFIAKLEGAYDWLGSLQSAYKHTRRFFSKS